MSAILARHAASLIILNLTTLRYIALLMHFRNPVWAIPKIGTVTPLGILATLPSDNNRP